MNEDLEYNPDFQKKRWFGYFDLLGIKNLIKSKPIINVFSIYAEAIKAASENLKRMPRINWTWFSDTFLIFSS